MIGEAKNYFIQTLEQIEKDGLYKIERVITSPQRANISVSTGAVLIVCK
jgi:glycine C-acetyltransferase